MNFKYVKSILAGCYLVLATTLSLSAAEGASVSALKTEILQGNGKYTIHTVAKGETAYSIARLYNISVSDIYALNPKAEKGLKLDEQIKIPVINPPVNQAVNSNGRSYVVKSKETLYSIAKQVGLKVDDLVNANPELKLKPLHEGQSLLIPSLPATRPSNNVAQPVAQAKSRFIEHQVAPKETLYGIARQYNTTPEALTDFNPVLKNGLKQGMTILIPSLQPQSSNSSYQNGQTPVSTLRDIDAIKVGVVLPFINKSQGKSARFIEYYEGFLLALEEMKVKGLSANVYVFDMGSETGTTKLKSLLETSEMKDLDLIIGGFSSDQIDVLSNFAKKQGIKYAIPFPTKTNETQKNTEVFQLNAPHEVLYNNTTRTLANLFGNANVIYITESGNNDKKEFVTALNAQLSQKGMRATSVAANQHLSANLALALDANRRNVIVAASGSAQLLQTLLPVLSSLREKQPNLNMSLFGHTEWQTYPQFFTDLYKNDTYIYTPFYMSDDDYKTKQFISNYKKWYNNKSLINTYPKYGALGYDTGIYFLTGLFKHGKNFESSVNSISVPALQTPISFNKVNAAGGYMNNGFYIVHYKSNGSVDKIEYGK
ncbi:ABC-type branched-subunit amino acid transport system substrate-binding protein [Dysgonomonas alginatilytica]|uniref:ABC-type branched-subunit amino acid transport system substrate-binding protein n=1 Tax=Dysgonomonas alginatilytica TaxID=1605892 RepID=A0A2V3PSK9_9BACT|nr:LysM peptidoglycan-binding domain-containing protein [Dysgonomonas alginatilytica]PXV67989.1 ABC-type branched-subunit amino acid transport system substrate-binding protein [Dysgonomonas alginatilytica]